MTFTAPKHFNINAVEEFLSTSERAYWWKDKMVPNFIFDLSKIEKISIIGLLLIYKFIDFTYNNHCFEKPRILKLKPIEEAWTTYEFDELIKAYVSNKDNTEKAYKEFKVKFDDQFIIAPQALLRGNDYSRQYLKNEFLPKIEKYYSYNEKAVELIFSCLCEVLLNFWEHAVDDTKTIIIADGNKYKIEIACADTGEGIISSLKDYLNIPLSRKEDIIEKAMEKGVTSKRNTDHMGYGLWIVNEIIKANKSRLHVYSQGAYYKNDYGKIKKGKCGYWPGTIVYLNIDLSNPKTISDLEKIYSTRPLKIKFT